MSSRAEPFLDKQQFQANIGRLWAPVLRKLNRILHHYVVFNCCFLGLAVFEVILFFAFFALPEQSVFLAVTLAIFFMTLFSYFVLKLYFQAKKPEQLMQLCDAYLSKCKEIIRYQEGIPEHHIALGSAAQKFATALHEREYSFYTPPPFLKSLEAALEKFSCYFHWKELHRMKELLLTAAVEEHLKAIKCEPTHLEIHASLANAYVMLSALYADPRKYADFDDESYIPKERTTDEMQEKFRRIAERAIEEFNILKDYAPDDPWVHIQLAYSYHDLQMPEEEIKEYEAVLALKPNDVDTQFKLGMLYFQQGQNAKGLRIYDLLKRTQYQKAESLIKFYGTFELP